MRRFLVPLCGPVLILIGLWLLVDVSAAEVRPRGPFVGGILLIVVGIYLIYEDVIEPLLRRLRSDGSARN